MKNIYLHDIYIPLGYGLKYIEPQEDKKWLYLVPSASLIPVVKDLLVIQHSRLQKHIDIMTFDQMMRNITINDHRRVLIQEEQELLVKKAIEKMNSMGKLDYFQGSMKKTGLVNQVEMWIGEIKRAGITPEALIRLWGNHSEKYRELAMIYDAYQDLLKKYGLIDHEEPYLTFLAQENQQEDFLSDYHGIVTDQFYDFSPIQMGVLNKLGDNGHEINIHITMDDERTELFQWNSNTIKYLNQLGFKKKNVVRVDHSETNPLNQIRHSLFSEFPEKIDANGTVEIMALSGMNQEVDMIAAEIKALVLDDGVALDDIAIITPRIDQYQELLNKVMTKSGIPIRLRKQEALIQNPFIQSMVSLLKAIHAQKKDWMNIIYSPYFTWSKEITSTTLMMILRDLSFPMSRKAWNERFKIYVNKHEDRKAELQKYDTVMQQIFDFMIAAPKKGEYQDFIKYMDQLEQSLKVEKNIKSYFIANPTLQSAFRDIKAYEKWRELKTDLLLIDKYLQETDKMTFWNWIRTLIIAIENSKYNYNQGKGTGVYLLAPNQIRGRKYKVVFVLGLTNGEFPRAIKNDWLLPDYERYLLRKQGFHLSMSRDYENQQKYHFFQSTLATTDKLYLVYSAKTEEGKERLQSFFIDELLDLFIDTTINKKTLEVSDILPKKWKECVYDSQLINKSFYSLNHLTSTVADKERAEANIVFYQRKNQMLIDTILNGMESESERWLEMSPYDGVLQWPATLEEIKTKVNHNIWSTTQLNLAMNCRFAYFAQNILKLSKWEEQEESLSPIEKGDILHRILQRFLGLFRNAEETVFDPLKEEEYKRVILNIAEEEWNQFKNQEGRYIDAVISQLDWQKLRRDVLHIFNHEVYFRKNSQSYFYPKYLELSFGLPINDDLLEKGEIDPNSIKEKAEISLLSNSISLRGKIDRMDVNQDGHFVIYDYKSGIAANNKEIKEGLQLQLPLYLLVIEALLGYDLEKAIGASYYTKGTKNKHGEITDSRNRGIWKEQYLELVGLSKRISSKIEESKWQDWIHHIKEKIENRIIEMENGDYSVLPETECPVYCPFQHICRKDEERTKWKKSLREVR